MCSKHWGLWNWPVTSGMDMSNWGDDILQTGHWIFALVDNILSSVSLLSHYYLADEAQCWYTCMRGMIKWWSSANINDHYLLMFIIYWIVLHSMIFLSLSRIFSVHRQSIKTKIFSILATCVRWLVRHNVWNVWKFCIPTVLKWFWSTPPVSIKTQFIGEGIYLFPCGQKQQWAALDGPDHAKILRSF